MPSDRVWFDHLAIGVERWPDAYPRFVRDLGGRWSHGGDAGEFAPYQLTYGHGMRLEFIAPGSVDGFMRRFIHHRGPGPHHITFKVPSLDRTLHELAGLGIDTLGGRTSMPFWQEAFLHPKRTGVGTLIQVAQTDDTYLNRIDRSGPPDGFPPALGEPRSISWVALTVERIATAEPVFADVLGGEIVEQGERWRLITWDEGHSVLLREAGGDLPVALARPPGDAPGDALGVGHVLFGPAELRVKDLDPAAITALPPDRRTGTLILIAND